MPQESFTRKLCRQHDALPVNSRRSALHLCRIVRKTTLNDVKCLKVAFAQLSSITMAYELSTENKLRINQVSATGIAVLKDVDFVMLAGH